MGIKPGLSYNCFSWSLFCLFKNSRSYTTWVRLWYTLQDTHLKFNEEMRFYLVSVTFFLVSTENVNIQLCWGFASNACEKLFFVVCSWVFAFPTFLQEIRSTGDGTYILGHIPYNSGKYVDICISSTGSIALYSLLLKTITTTYKKIALGNEILWKNSEGTEY